MKDEYFKKDYFDFDSNGCNTKIISNSTSGISKITWKKHKNNVLFKILESEKNTLKTKTYFYENKKKYIQIIGVSKNENNNLFNTEVKNYENIETTYFIYDTSKNKTYTKTFLSSKKIPFQKNSYFYKGKKLLKSKTEHKYFSYKNDSTFYQYNSFNNLLEKITFFPADYDTPFYININYDNNKIISINKFELNSKKLIETQEFLYSKKTDYLHAIITKNTLTKELFIKKYNYTLY